MFRDEQEPLTLLLELSPRLAKRRYRQAIYEAWNHKCGYCEEMATSLDHIVPKFKSGSNNRYNLVPACRKCNADKGSKNMEEWFKTKDYFSQVELEAIKTWMSDDVKDIMIYT